MNRRERIKIGMGASGGTEAPNARRKQIREGLTKGPQGARTLPAGLPPIRYPQNSPTRPKSIEGPALRVPGGPGVGGAMQPKLGAQLSNRVQGGAITQAQAQRTAKQRQTLRAAFGSDWRDTVFGQEGAKAGQEAGPFGRPSVQARRTKMLERARRLRNGNGGTSAPS